MKNENALTKVSDNNQIRQYFKLILKLKESGEEFPVDLDEVWPLVYSRKDEAVRVLSSDFIQDADYQVFHKKADNPLGGRPTIYYYLTVPCLEYFIAKKVRTVFDVYREVFHKTANSLSVPRTFAEALRLAADLETQRELERSQKELAHAKLKEQAPDVKFANAVKKSESDCLVGSLAKMICQNGVEIGQKRLFEWMRDNGYLMRIGRSKNEPTQRSMNAELFRIIERRVELPSGRIIIQPTTMVTGKGQVYFINKFLKEEVEL